MVDDVEVGPHARLQGPPVGHAVEAGGVPGLLLDQPLQRELFAAAAVPGPVGQGVGGQRGVADHPAVGAAVTQAEDGRGVQQLLADGLVVALGVVEQRQHDEALAVVLEQGVVEDVLLGAPGGLGDAPDGGLAGGLVVGRLAHHVEALDHHVEEGPDPVEEDVRVRRLVRLLEDRRLGGRVLQGDHQLVQGQVGEGHERRPLLEDVVGLEAGQQPERAGGDLRAQVGAGVDRLQREVHQLPPQVRGGVQLEEGEADRAVDLGAEARHPVDLLVRIRGVQPVDGGRGQLEHAAADLAQRAADAEQLVFRGEGAGDRLAVHGTVGQGAGRRKAHGAGFDRLLDDGGHLLDVLRRGRLVLGAPLAHHVAPHGAVGDLDADVDGEGTAVEHVEVLREGLPVPRHAFGQRCAGDVLDPLHELDEPLLLAGVDGGEADAAVAGDDRGHAVAGGRVEHLVPGGLAVVVGVDVDEAGGDQLPVGVDDLGGLALDGADGHDLAVLHRHVAPSGVGTGAVDDRPVPDDQVVHATSPGE